MREIARIALSEGMTAKEAGVKFGVSAESVRKVICRFKLPNLITEYERMIIMQVARLNDTQLQSYYKALLLPKNKKVSKIEKNTVVNELKKRKLS